MDNKINRVKIDEYSDQLTTIILDKFYATSSEISGEEILKVSSIEQVNLFTLKTLFVTWQQEIKKLESPYFDYKHEAVKNAVDQLKAVVSKHISVNRTHFEPIFRKSVADMLLLLCSPYQYYLNTLATLGNQGTISTDDLNSERKFTKINQPILKGIISAVEQVGGIIPTSEAHKLLDKVIGNMSEEPEDVSIYIEQFNNILPLNINDLYNEVQEATHKEKEKAKSKTKKSDKKGVGHQRELSLNDHLAGDSKKSLAEVHEERSIESISKGISLNQRFMFVNVLFDGDVAKFNNTVLELDGLPRIDMALNYLSTHFGHWNADSQEVKEFMNVLQKRYV